MPRSVAIVRLHLLFSNGLVSYIDLRGISAQIDRLNGTLLDRVHALTQRLDYSIVINEDDAQLKWKPTIVFISTIAKFTELQSVE